MRSCLIATALSVVLAAWLARAEAEPRAHKLTLVVRADPRSGRLVRAAVVQPRPVRSVPVEPRVIEPGRLSWLPDLENFIEQMAARYELDPLLVRAVIEVESGYDPAAISPKGAVGLMQLMPQTARRVGVRDVFNPWENVEGGVRYLKYLLELFGGDKRLALAAYNAGEGAVLRYGGVPPYPETTAYVYRVGRKLGEKRRSLARESESATVNQPKVVEYLDSQGRWHIRTQGAP